MTASNSGTVALVDAQSGLRASFSLLFGSLYAGQMTLSNTGGTAGSQSGTFTATNYTVVTSAELYQPVYSNGTFQAYLGGQPDAGYSVDVSSDMQSWSPLASLSLATMTGAFTDSNAASSARFYRARATSVDYAPNSISGQSLDFAALEGSLASSTNEFLKFYADASDAGYQMIIGPSMTNTTGTYQYEKIAPGAALIASVDQQNNSNSIRLVFTGPAAGFYYATNETAGFQAGSFTMAHGPVVYLGTYHFTPDPSRAASAYFSANGSTAPLSVTDIVNNVGTLSLPADALLTPQTITMTPVASVDSSGAAFFAPDAVLLDPDGLQFCDGVTLTLTTPAPLGTNASLLSAEKDGTQVNLLEMTTGGNSFSAILFHFSSGVVGVPTSQQLLPLATAIVTVQQAFNQAQADAQNLEANYQPPPPPPYDWPCDPEMQASEMQAINAYLTSLFRPEAAVINRLSNAALAMNKLGNNSLTTQSGAVFSQLFQQDIYKKVSYLIRAYGSQPTEFYGVGVVALVETKQGILLNALPPSALLLNLASDGSSVGNYYLQDLRNNHNYSPISTVRTVATLLLYLRGDAASLLAGLGQALTFQLTLDIYASAVESYASGVSDTITLEATGSFQLTYETTSVQGSGTCNYVLGSNITTAGGGSGGFSIAPGQSFAENCTAVLSSCPIDFVETAALTFNGFGSTTETWNFPAGPTVVEDFLGITAVCFASEKTSQGYTFLLPLENGSAQAVNSSFTATGSNGTQDETATLQVTLQHTPQ